MEFVGRDHELQSLRESTKAAGTRSCLSAVYGRRRIGKTRLVTEASAGENLIVFEGLEDQGTATQKEQFFHGLKPHLARIPVGSLDVSRMPWRDLLILLSKALGRRRTVVLLDEFQWLAANRRELVSHLKYVWDNHLSKHNRVHLILCGSISSFIVKKVIRSRALYGRLSLDVHLGPLGLPDFVNAMARSRSLRELVEYFMVVGGVPEYLQLFDPKQSTRLNLERLCFSRLGYLVDEFSRLFVSHFGTNPHYQRIVRYLAGRRFATRPALQKGCQLEVGGRTSAYLEELELAGFIESYEPFDRAPSSRLKRYRICDPYLSFYFRFVFPMLRKIKAATEPLAIGLVTSEARYSSWQGLAFERLCRAHVGLIAERLGFSAVRYDAGSWFGRQHQEGGFQVDLAFRRADQVISLCELKYRRERIGKEIIAEVEAKVDALRRLGQYSIEPVLITASPVTAGLRAEGYFVRVLDLEALFAP